MNSYKQKSRVQFQNPQLVRFIMWPLQSSFFPVGIIVTWKWPYIRHPTRIISYFSDKNQGWLMPPPRYSTARNTRFPADREHNSSQTYWDIAPCRGNESRYFHRLHLPKKLRNTYTPAAIVFADYEAKTAPFFGTESTSPAREHSAFCITRAQAG